MNSNSILRKIRQSKITKKIWNSSTRLISSNEFLSKVVRKAALDAGLIAKEYKKLNESCLIDLYNPSKKEALIIVPWWGDCATCVNIENICTNLKSLGFRIHLLHFNDYPFFSKNKFYDFCYSVFPLVKEGRRAAKGPLPGQESGNNVDDWVDFGLLEYVKKLDSIYHFDVCLCNYVYLSAALEVLSKNCLKLLLTHDIFSYRNEKLKENGIEEKYFDFSCVEVEETKGYSRADIVLALQDKDAITIGELIGPEKVVTLPFVPPKRYLPLKKAQDKIRIAFFASAHRPNVIALENFVRSFSEKLNASQKVELLVAGSICPHIKDWNFPEYVKILGLVEQPVDFYEKVDLLINPDQVFSGIKIKTLEAMSFGKPLVATKAAFWGIESKNKFHNCLSTMDCVQSCVEIIQDPHKLEQLREDSIRVFDTFKSKYDTRNILLNLIYKKTIAKFKKKNKSETFFRFVTVLPDGDELKTIKELVISLGNQTNKNFTCSVYSVNKISDSLRTENEIPDCFEIKVCSTTQNILEDLLKSEEEFVCFLHSDGGFEPEFVNKINEVLNSKEDIDTISTTSYSQLLDGKLHDESFYSGKAINLTTLRELQEKANNDLSNYSLLPSQYIIRKDFLLNRMDHFKDISIHGFLFLVTLLIKEKVGRNFYSLNTYTFGLTNNCYVSTISLIKEQKQLQHYLLDNPLTLKYVALSILSHVDLSTLAENELAHFRDLFESSLNTLVNLDQRMLEPKFKQNLVIALRKS